MRGYLTNTISLSVVYAWLPHEYYISLGRLCMVTSRILFLFRSFMHGYLMNRPTISLSVVFPWLAHEYYFSLGRIYMVTIRILFFFRSFMHGYLTNTISLSVVFPWLAHEKYMGLSLGLLRCHMNPEC